MSLKCCFQVKVKLYLPDMLMSVQMCPGVISCQQLQVSLSLFLSEEDVDLGQALDVLMRRSGSSGGSGLQVWSTLQELSP